MIFPLNEGDKCSFKIFFPFLLVKIKLISLISFISFINSGVIISSFSESFMLIILKKLKNIKLMFELLQILNIKLLSGFCS